MCLLVSPQNIMQLIRKLDCLSVHRIAPHVLGMFMDNINDLTVFREAFN